MSKGSWQRPVKDVKSFDSEYDRIFKKKTNTIEDDLSKALDDTWKKGEPPEMYYEFVDSSNKESKPNKKQQEK